MGNCIEKNRSFVVEYGNLEAQSNDQIQMQKNEGSGFDNGLMNARNDAQNRKSKIPPPSSVSGSIEHIHQRSHPLPPPNSSKQTQSQEDDRSTDFPLPKSEIFPHFDDINFSVGLMAEAPNILPFPPTESQILASPNLKTFSLKELGKATKNFSENCLLGKGGFGCVYKGWIDEETLKATKQGVGTSVAIKKLIPYGFQGHKEWLSEVNYLGRLRHPNLVLLIGYCLEGVDRILVYEFMPGGSVEDHLFQKKFRPLSWGARVKVAIGAARGLCFLHNSYSPVIYRDFKTSNILLDSEFNVKLADFGLAKTGPTGLQSHVSTRIMGTEGYCDPHYRSTGKLTIKCDVYSFGVVLLELLTGRRVIEETRCQEEKNLVQWVRLHVKDKGRVFRIMDSKLGGQYCKKSAYIAANIALRCVHHEPKYRPPMTYILEILENLPSQKQKNSIESIT